MIFDNKRRYINDSIQFLTQIDQDLYEEINDLLASHIDYSDVEVERLRNIIKMVAHKLKMNI